MAEIISQYVNLTNTVAGIVIAALTFYFTNRNNKRKMDIEGDASTVKNAKDIQEMYERAFEEFETRWTKRLDDQDKECEKQINSARRALEDQAREKQGELLVMIDELQRRNQDLKIQVAELGGIVQGATGLKIHQWTNPPQEAKR